MTNKSFTLIEILIAMVLMGLIILAVVSVDITSRRFFGSASEQAQVQDEAKIAMEHIIKNVQRGVGDMTNAEIADGNNPPDPNNTRGFYILDTNGNLATSGYRLQVKQDLQSVEYEYLQQDPADANLKNYIRFYPDATDRDTFEKFAEGRVESAVFSVATDAGGDEDLKRANQVIVTIEVRREPGEDPSLDNPETTLTSSIVLRAMSTN